MQTLYLLSLDRHHLGDELFLKSLAQEFASAGTGARPSLVVHGSGEKVERTLEARGVFPERTGGVLEVESDEHRKLVERAVREVNQELVAGLTDQVVSTVGIQGVDRGLFKREEGELRATNVGWVSALVKQHIIPVVSALVEETDPQQIHEAGTAEAVVALARALEASFDPVACVFTTTDTPGVPHGDEGIREAVSIEELSEKYVPEPWAVTRMSEVGLSVLLTNLEGFFAPSNPKGTWVRD